ncbi:substrate-binding domain-containing protein [Streptomyces sp. NPDC018584]|uniref:substrate-binding domain-containing protein n=1 Tax=unclassified Streptomyces TaxID=2593676 RepID=UPI0037895907
MVALHDGDAVPHLVERGHRSLARVSGPGPAPHRLEAASAVVPLTPVRRPASATGRQACRLLIEDMAHGIRHTHRHVVPRPEPVVRRATVAAPTP